MTLDDIPLFSTLKSRLGYLTDRQNLIAENVANADTAGYAPRDLSPFTVPGSDGSGQLTMAPVQGNPAFLTAPGMAMIGAATWKAKTTPDSETTVNGNQVVLEEEMMKMTDARMNYETALGFYQKSMSMIQLALRTPGKGG